MGLRKVHLCTCSPAVKVVLIYRPRRLGGHSIEELFRTVMKELRKHVEVLEYETGSRWCVLLDAWKLRRLQADIYHVTGDINYLVLLLPWRKVVLTIHDHKPRCSCSRFQLEVSLVYLPPVYLWPEVQE